MCDSGWAVTSLHGFSVSLEPQEGSTLTPQGRDSCKGMATLHPQMDLKWEVSQENQDTAKGTCPSEVLN